MQSWSANLPDLNPIENIWEDLGRTVRNQPSPPRDPAEMAMALTAP